MQTKKVKRTRSRKARVGSKRRVVKVKRTMKGGWLKWKDVKEGAKSMVGKIRGSKGAEITEPSHAFNPIEIKNPLFNPAPKMTKNNENFTIAMKAAQINHESSTMRDIIKEGKTAEYIIAKERYNTQTAEIDKRKANAQNKAQMINNTLEAARLSIAEIDNKLSSIVSANREQTYYLFIFAYFLYKLNKKINTLPDGGDNMSPNDPLRIKLTQQRDTFDAMINPIYNIANGTRTNPSIYTGEPDTFDPDKRFNPELYQLALDKKFSNVHYNNERFKTIEELYNTKAFKAGAIRPTDNALIKRMITRIKFNKNPEDASEDLATLKTLLSNYQHIQNNNHIAGIRKNYFKHLNIQSALKTPIMNNEIPYDLKSVPRNFLQRIIGDNGNIIIVDKRFHTNKPLEPQLKPNPAAAPYAVVARMN